MRPSPSRGTAGATYTGRSAPTSHQHQQKKSYKHLLDQTRRGGNLASILEAKFDYRYLCAEEVEACVKGMVRLERLSLAHNLLNKPPALPSSVTALDLSFNNEMEGLHTWASRAGPSLTMNLRELRIDSAGLTTTRIFNAFSALVTLSLRDNLLVRVDGLESLMNLRALDLANNGVKTQLDLRSLGCNTALEILDLRGNAVCQTPAYRFTVQNYVPSLLEFDGKSVKGKAVVKSNSIAPSSYSSSPRTPRNPNFTSSEATGVLKQLDISHLSSLSPFDASFSMVGGGSVWFDGSASPTREVPHRVKKRSIAGNKLNSRREGDPLPWRRPPIVGPNPLYFVKSQSQGGVEGRGRSFSPTVQQRTQSPSITHGRPSTSEKILSESATVSPGTIIGSHRTAALHRKSTVTKPTSVSARRSSSSTRANRRPHTPVFYNTSREGGENWRSTEESTEETTLQYGSLQYQIGNNSGSSGFASSSPYSTGGMREIRSVTPTKTSAARAKFGADRVTSLTVSPPPPPSFATANRKKEHEKSVASTSHSQIEESFISQVSSSSQASPFRMTHQLSLQQSQKSESAVEDLLSLSVINQFLGEDETAPLFQVRPFASVQKLMKKGSGIDRVEEGGPLAAHAFPRRRTASSTTLNSAGDQSMDSKQDGSTPNRNHQKQEQHYVAPTYSSRSRAVKPQPREGDAFSPLGVNHGKSTGVSAPLSLSPPRPPVSSGAPDANTSFSSSPITATTLTRQLPPPPHQLNFPLWASPERQQHMPREEQEAGGGVGRTSVLDVSSEANRLSTTLLEIKRRKEESLARLVSYREN